VKIIDFRCKPPYRKFLELAFWRDSERREAMSRQIGFAQAPSALERSLELMLHEMDSAGIATALAYGRNAGQFGAMPNSDVAELVRLHPERFIAVGAIDPSNRREGMRQIEEARALGIRILTVEPGALPAPMHIDDARLYPFYAWCEDNHTPLVIVSGGQIGPDISYTSPEHIERVLRDFPTLRVVAGHAGWPWVQQIIHVALRRPNLYLSPDMYLYNMPGMDDYLRAANGFLQDRFLFATCYPMCPIIEYTEWFMRLPLRHEVMEKALYRNAARLLGLET
jgi:predicted TIM-barrel fold metal-dependent hydrolase